MDQVEVPTDAILHTQALALGELLRGRAQVLATAESCTGGWIGKLLTDIPGSSVFFAGSAVTYSNASKQALLGVAAATLERRGAVSGEVAQEMASGALTRLGASVAVAVTGIAGPSGGTPAKPVGTVWIAWQLRAGTGRAEVFRFEGDRDAIRRHAVAAALHGIQEILTR
jgi:nicotinamide-nucleotide amidase